MFEFGNGETLVIYGRPSPSKADHTQLRFWSTAIEKDVKELAAAGVVFDELDMGAIKTVDHIATVHGIGRSAWFIDPDGNTLALFQAEQHCGAISGPATRRSFSGPSATA